MSPEKTPEDMAAATLLRELIEQTKRGLQSERLFRALVDSVRDYAIFMLDSTGHIATWNVGAERIKGFAADEIIGRHFSVFYPDEDVVSGKCELELEVAARDGRFEDEGWRLRKDRTRFWANVVISAVRDERGYLIGYSKVTRDLTDRRKAEEERAARLAAEQSNRAKDEFLAMLGHELRNPLAPIMTALQLMKLRGQAASREHQVIERQVNHMMRLVDDLLDVSRITRERIALKKQSLDLRDVISKAVEVASPVLEQRRHHFSIDATQTDLVVAGDEARLTQVFANLLVNAAKYTPAGGHVGVSIRRSGEHVTIEVHDDGMGIAAELLPRVFDLFVQGYQGVERTVGGLGIGLTLVRSLVGMHGGTVEAASAGVGMGSTFTVRLPALVGDFVAEPRSDAPTTILRTRRPRKILVVDDNEDALVLLAEMLGSIGHDVATAGDAAEALHVIRAFTPDVAILDIGLPVMDGYALATRLRTELAPAAVRLIAVTGYGQQHDRDRSFDAGFHAHLVKPIDAQRLMDTISDEGGLEPIC